MSSEENVKREQDNVLKHEHNEEDVYNVGERDQDEIDEEVEEDEEQKLDIQKETGLKRTRSEAEIDVGDNDENINEKNNNENEEGEDDDEEDDEDEDEDEDEDDDGVSTGRRRKRRRAGNQFIDIEAEVDDEEEDELDEDDEEAELLREQFIADDRHAGENEAESHDDRLHRQYDRRRQEAEDQDAEVLAETLKQRYRKTHTVYRGDTAASGTVSQKLLMPSINDPSIYAIRCTPGREKDLVRKLYEKKRTLDRLNAPLDILTVFQRDAFKGYIYICLLYTSRCV